MAFTVSYIIELFDKYSPNIRRATSSTERFEQSIKSLKRHLPAMGAQLKAVGDRMANFRSAAGLAGVTLALKSIIGPTIDFEKAMNEVEAITGEGADTMAKLRKQADLLAGETQYDLVQVATAQAEFARAGVKSADILQLMPKMLSFAAAGNLQLADAVEISTDVLKSYTMPLANIGHLSDVLAWGASNSSTNVYQMAEALRNTASTANLAGMSIEETTAALMMLANAGIKGGEAGTQLMNALRTTVQGQGQFEKTLKRLGIRSTQVVDKMTGKIKDFTGLIDLLAQRKATLKDLFDLFDIRGGKAVSILKAQGVVSLREFTDKMKGLEGTADKMAQIMMQGLPGAILRLISAFGSAKNAMTQSFKKPLIFAIDRLTAFITTLKETKPEILGFISLVLWLGAGLGLLIIPAGLIISALGSIVGLLGSLLGPAALVAGGIAAIAAATAYWANTNHPLIGSIKKLGFFFSDIITSLMAIFMGTKNAQKGFYEFGMLAASVISAITAGLNILMAIIKSTVSVVVAAAKLMTFDFSGAWDTLKTGGASTFESLKRGASSVVDTFANLGGAVGIGGRAVGAYELYELKATPMQTAQSNLEQAATATPASAKLTGEIAVRAMEGAAVEKATITQEGLGQNLAMAGF